MKISVTLSANAGVSLELAGKKIWIDALHEIRQPGFSAVNSDLAQKMERCPAFSEPDLIMCTHCHEDHFSREMVLSAMKSFPNAKVLLPEQKIDGQILVPREGFCYELGEVKLHLIPLTHEGAQYVNCIHFGVRLELDGKNILIPGDCRLCEEALAQEIFGQKIHLALMNFPWLTLPQPRSFLLNRIQPDRVLFYHLPFAEDDVNGFRSASEKWLQKLEDPRFGLLYQPLQRIEIDL